MLLTSSLWLLPPPTPPRISSLCYEAPRTCPTPHTAQQQPRHSLTPLRAITDTQRAEWSSHNHTEHASTRPLTAPDTPLKAAQAPEQPCTSARQLTLAIKQCKQWEQLQHLVLSHSPSSLSSNDTSSQQGHQQQQQQQEQQHSHSSSSSLDAPLINHLHLAATLTHLAQLGADPNTDSRLQVWCLSLLEQVTQPPQLHALSARQLANVLWACARLGMHGRGGVSKSAEQQGEGELWWGNEGEGVPSFDSLRTGGARGMNRPSDTAHTADTAGTACVQCWGGGRHASTQARAWQTLLDAHARRVQEAMRVEHSVEQQSQQQNQAQQHNYFQQQSQQQQSQQQQQEPLRMQDLVNVVYACAQAGRHPGEEWMDLAMHASLPLLPQMKPQEAANWATALCTLGVAPTIDWSAAFLKCSEGLLWQMSPLELAATVRGVHEIVGAYVGGERSVNTGRGSSVHSVNADSSRGSNEHVSTGSSSEHVSTDSSGHGSSSSNSDSSNSTSTSTTSKNRSRNSDKSSTTTTRHPQTPLPPALSHWQRTCHSALSHALPSLDTARVSSVLWGLSQLSQITQGWRPRAPPMAAMLRAVLSGQVQNGKVQNEQVQNEQSGQAQNGQMQDGRMQNKQLQSGRAQSEQVQQRQAQKEGECEGLWPLQGRDKGGKRGQLGVQPVPVSLGKMGQPVSVLQGVQLSSWAAANVLTAVARMGVQPCDDWVEQVLSALIAGASVSVGGDRGLEQPTHSYFSQQQSYSQQQQHSQQHIQQQQHTQQQQQQQRRPLRDRASASRLLADVDAAMLACVLMGYRPPPVVMHQLVGLALDGLPWAAPHEAADMLWALAKLSFAPNKAWLSAFFSVTGRVLHAQALQHQQLCRQAALQQQQEREDALAQGSEQDHISPLSSYESEQQQRHFQQQQQVQRQQGRGFEADALCKLLWALASLSQMQQRAATQHLHFVHSLPLQPHQQQIAQQQSQQLSQQQQHAPLNTEPRSLTDPTADPATSAEPQTDNQQQQQRVRGRRRHANAPVLPSVSQPQAQLTAPTTQAVQEPLYPPSPNASLITQHMHPQQSAPTQHNTSLTTTTPQTTTPQTPQATATLTPQTTATTPHTQQQHPPPHTPTLPPAWQEAALATLHSLIPHLAPQHLPELVWSLSTLDIIPPPVSRRRLAFVVATHAHVLQPKHLSAVVGCLPRMCVTRANDKCGLLRVLLGAAHASLHQMRPKEVAYFLSGLHGMGYVLSKKALLQLAVDLSSFPLMHQMTAKDLVSVVDALAGMDMGQLPLSTPYNHARQGRNGSQKVDKSSSRQAEEAIRQGGSLAADMPFPVTHTASITSTPVKQLQHTLLSLLQPRLKLLRAPQIASLVNALSLLGWRPPTSFWPSLYASLASRQAGRKDFVSVPALKGSSAAAKRSSRSAGPAQTSTSVLLALAKYSSMAAAVDEAEAAAAALRSESAAASLVSAADTPVDVANDQQSPAVDVGQQHKTEQQQSTQQQQGQEGASQNDQFILPPSAVVHRLLDQVSGDLAALRANEVAELVLALVRLKHDPGGNWMRGLLEHLETRSAACNREDHQMLQHAWRRLNRARKAGQVRKHRRSSSRASGK